MLPDRVLRHCPALLRWIEPLDARADLSVATRIAFALYEVSARGQDRLRRSYPRSALVGWARLSATFALEAAALPTRLLATWWTGRSSRRDRLPDPTGIGRDGKGGVAAAKAREDCRIHNV